MVAIVGRVAIRGAIAAATGGTTIATARAIITAATTVVITTTRAFSIYGGPVGIGLGSIDLFGDLLKAFS